MLKSLYLFSSVLLLCNSLYAQKIVKNEIDEFTKSKIIKTDYSMVYSNMKSTLYLGFHVIDEYTFVKVALYNNYKKYYIVSEGDKVVFMLSDSSMVTLANRYTTMASTGGSGTGKLYGSGAIGINLSYLIDPDQISQLKQLDVIKYRLYTADGYIENEFPERNKDIFKRLFTLLEN